jgi:spermidine dehydrogenase
VLLRDWRAFAKAGMQSIHAPGSYHSSVSLASQLAIGGYRTVQDPGGPMVIHMTRTPCKPGLPARDQHRAGRTELLGASFEDIERKIRDQLTRTFSSGNFDPARDIAGITVNRWAHGYAYQYNSLWEPFWLEGGETPCEVARRPHGRIAIANADAGAYAYADGAIDHAHRAVRELVG